MLSETKIIALYCIVDDLLQSLGHTEDSRVRVSDAEVITTAFVACLYFGGHLDNARWFMQHKGYVPRMLDKSRFCRRLHRTSDLIVELFFVLGTELKQLAGAATYVLDSFPVAVCDNMRINRCRLLQQEAFRGKHAAMRRYFYGVKVQVLTLSGVPVEFCLVPGREHDSRALYRLLLDVAPESTIYMDAGYTDYKAEDWLFEAEAIIAAVQRKKNSKRKDAPELNFLKEQSRKGIETTFSVIKKNMPRSIHAVTTNGWMLKVTLFVVAFAFEQIA